MKVVLLSYTPNPEKTIACAAKLCYSPSSIGNIYDGLTDEKANDFVEMLSEIGHQSPIEHANFTFGIEGVSRSFLAQITRHRLASYSVQSQRYVKKGEFGYVIPKEIEQDKIAKEIFINAMEQDVENYNKLTEVLMDKHFKNFVMQGKDEKTAKRLAEKKAIEDARSVLPNACDTQMVVTMNARSLMNFFKHRCCLRAQDEIKQVSDEMLKLVLAVAPTLFSKAGPACISGGCPEGKMTCGKIQAVRDFYKDMKEKV